jgi:hypothetical protein
MIRGIFQCFEEGVGGLCRHRISVINKADFVRSDEWAINDQVFDGPYLVDFDFGVRLLGIFRLNN